MRRLILVPLAALLLLPAAASAASPETATVSTASPKAAWTGTLEHPYFLHMAFNYEATAGGAGSLPCEAPQCDTFTLEVADSADLSIVVASEATPDLSMRIQDPTGTWTYYDGWSDAAKPTTVKIKKAAKGTYVVNVVARIFGTDNPTAVEDTADYTGTATLAVPPPVVAAPAPSSSQRRLRPPRPRRSRRPRRSSPAARRQEDQEKKKRKAALRRCARRSAAKFRSPLDGGLSSALASRRPLMWTCGVRLGLYARSSRLLAHLVSLGRCGSRTERFSERLLLLAADCAFFDVLTRRRPLLLTRHAESASRRMGAPHGRCTAPPAVHPRCPASACPSVPRARASALTFCGRCERCRRTACTSTSAPCLETRRPWMARSTERPLTARAICLRRRRCPSPPMSPQLRSEMARRPAAARSAMPSFDQDDPSAPISPCRAAFRRRHVRRRACWVGTSQMK